MPRENISLGTVKENAEEVASVMRDLRRWLHRHAKPAFEEQLTVAMICYVLTKVALQPEKLTKGGLSPEELTEVGQHLQELIERGLKPRELTEVFTDMGLQPEKLTEVGLRPEVRKGSKGSWWMTCDVGPEDAPIVAAFRADMDALPFEDPKDVPYRSTTGATHACGHDVHTSIMLGVALTMAALHRQGLLKRRFRFLFQHAEEKGRGAKDLIKAGVVDGVPMVLGGHCDPSLDVGRFGLVEGPITSSVCEVDITLTGPGGHTSRPHETTDLMLVQAHVLLALQSLKIDPRKGYSLVFGEIELPGGSARNVIPGKVTLRGTLRALERETEPEVIGEIRRVVRRTAKAHGARYKIRIKPLLPPTVNDAECIALLRRAVPLTHGEAAVASTRQSLGGDDFALYGELAKIAYIRVGVCPPGGKAPDLHTELFDVADDLEVIKGAIEVFTAAGLEVAGTPVRPAVPV